MTTMSNLPRKILFVKRVPPAEGYVAMIEVNDRTLSLQITKEAGDVLMEQVQDIIVKYGVQHGWVVPAPLNMPRPVPRRRKRI